MDCVETSLREYVYNTTFTETIGKEEIKGFKIQRTRESAVRLCLHEMTEKLHP